MIPNEPATQPTTTVLYPDSLIGLPWHDAEGNMWRYLETSNGTPWTCGVCGEKTGRAYYLRASDRLLCQKHVTIDLTALAGKGPS